MSKPAVIEVDELVAPLSGPSPVGQYLRWEDEYAELEEARRADEDAGSDDVWARDKKASDWPTLLRLGTSLLETKTKDLQVAAWVAEAASHIYGAVGLRDGLRLVLALQEAFWDTLHPDSGDLELREAVFDFINHERVFPLLVRNLVVTHVPGAPEYTYTFLDYEKSRETDLLANRQFKSDDDRELALEGRLTGEVFDQAVQATERRFYVDLMTTCEECLEAVEKIGVGIRERWKGSNRPSLGKLETTLAALKKMLQQTLAKKPDDSAPPEPEPEPEAEYESEPEADGWGSSEEAEDETAEEPRHVEPARRAAPARRRPAGAPTTAEDAIEQVAEAAHFLRGLDPSDPAPYLVLRALATAALYRPEGLDPANLPAPASEVRERLFLGSREENWPDVLDEAERAMGRAEGRGWLDLHRYSALALAASGHDDARRACASALKACLGDLSGWPDAQFRDGTPCISPSTRGWLEEEGLAGGPEPTPAVDLSHFAPAEPAPAAESGDDESSPARPQDAWEIAQEHARRGEAVEALSIIARAVRQAGSGRERFIRELQQAELCIALGRDALALPVLESLAARIDAQKLDQWEEPGLCARVFSGLYRCLRSRDEPRAAQIHHRLCQLDLGLAMQLEGN